MSEAPIVHPSFPQPDDLERPIWRYMDSDKFEWLVDHERLFMPRADRLSDPLEGSTPPGNLAWWQRLEQEAEDEEKRGIIAHNRRFFDEMVPIFRLKYYVSCWHMSSHENYSMWRCYTTTTDAVAIRTTYLTLRAELPATAYLGTIRYIDYEVDPLPFGNMFEYIMHKNINYRYEVEARAVVAPPPTAELGLDEFLQDHFCLTADKDFRFYAPKLDLRRLIQGIVLHPKASADFSEKIREICSTNGLPAPSPSRETAKPIY